jgi:spore maturation protein CgeB
MKKKLLHIMMGQHNPDFQRGLNTVFDCLHFDWTKFGQNYFQLQSELINANNNFNADYIFMHTQSDAVRIETLKELSKNSKIINWTGDVRKEVPNWMIDYSNDVDLTLFSNMNDVQTSIQKGVRADFLQVGFDKIHFNPLGEKGNYPEILFLGSNYGDMFPLSSFRRQMVERLKNEYGNRFGVYGNGWDITNDISTNHLYHLPHIKSNVNSTNKIADGNITNYAEEGKAYRSCKIAINLSHFAYSRYSSDRMFRILGSGTFCLTHRFPDIEKDFKIGEEVVVWESIDDLVSKINYYLKNEREREIIAMRGCALARNKYTWNNFAENLKQIIEKNER